MTESIDALVEKWLAVDKVLLRCLTGGISAHCCCCRMKRHAMKSSRFTRQTTSKNSRSDFPHVLSLVLPVRRMQCATAVCVYMADEMELQVCEQEWKQVFLEWMTWPCFKHHKVWPSTLKRQWRTLKREVLLSVMIIAIIQRNSLNWLLLLLFNVDLRFGFTRNWFTLLWW